LKLDQTDLPWRHAMALITPEAFEESLEKMKPAP